MKWKLLSLALVITTVSASAQLFENLRVLGGTRYPVGDPALTSTNLDGEPVEGPKDIAVADLDADGKPDFAASDKEGSLTLRFGVGDGTFGEPLYLRTYTNTPADLKNFYFTNYSTNLVCNYVQTNVVVTNFFASPAPPVIRTNLQWVCMGTVTNFHTNTWTIEGPAGLRGLAIADFTGDGRPDIAVASPGESVIYFFANLGNRNFAKPTQLPAWFGVRDLAAGDFDGDGWIDLVAAGTTNGVAQYRSLGGGTFVVVTNLVTLSSAELFDEDEFPQPAYYLKALHQPGDSRDELLVSFAQRGKIWVLRAVTNGLLSVTGDIEGVSLTALDVGPLLTPATNRVPDLVTSYSRGGWIEVFAATNLAQRFTGDAVARYYVPGGPRNVRIADLDKDGWNDLVVVSQLNDRVITYRNNRGQFSEVAQAVAGRAPREMDLGDFNGDGVPDLAVLNRFSADVSILVTSTNLTTPTGFLALDNVYPVDGGVSGLDLTDFNNDGRPDVLQLHRDSGEFSVRLTETNGHLKTPIYYPLTNAFQPAAQISADVNSDGRADMVSANLSGSVTVRLGLTNGGFGEPQTFSLPADAKGSLFALVPGDFDGDGHIDLAAGYLDCRVSFFRGDGTGRFTFTHTHYFVYEPRSMVVGDFDQDGDLDLAGGSLAGKIVVVENKGDLLTTTNLTKVEYGGGASFGANLRIVDQNNDGDPDLLLGSEGGFELFIGAPGMMFVRKVINYNNISGATFIFADFNGDRQNDIASICASNSCLTISVFTNGQYFPALTVAVPNTRYLAAGDLDGDGLIDLVGSGDVLWVALSGHRATNGATAELLAKRSSGGVVINELLAQNDSLPLVADGNRNTDWVEIYNGTSQAVPLGGWRLLLLRTNTVVSIGTNSLNGTNLLIYSTNLVTTTNTFTFTNDVPLAPRSHRLTICSDKLRSPYHTGFNLPVEGAALLLLDAQGSEMDRVDYPAQGSDLSFARYQDGLRSFVVNNIPSPAAANVDNGAVDPVLSFNGVNLEALQTPGQPLVFRATARDDQGIVNVSVLWRRLDITDNATKRLILFDDGANGGDTEAGDGVFTATFPLPTGAEIQFYLQCTDISDQLVTTPGNARFVSRGQIPQAHTLAVGIARPTLEISEIVADNVGGLRDEVGGTPDWVEIRNCSSNRVSLAGVGLSPKFFGDGERFNFTNWPSLAPGQHLVIYADSNPSQGALHSSFRLNIAGEQLVLTGTTPNGGRFLIDALNYGRQTRNVALSRLGCGGPWVANTPTPLGPNVAGSSRTLIHSNNFTLAFPTRSDRSYSIEYRDGLGAGNWTALPTVRGSGLEQTFSQPPSGPTRFFRVREQ